MKISLRSFLFLMVCISAFSCKKEGGNPTNTNQDTKPSYFCAIDKIYHNDSSHYSQYIYDKTYDVGNKEYVIDSIKTYDDQTLASFIKYHYYDDRSALNYRLLSKIEYFTNGKLDSFMSVTYKARFMADSYSFYRVINNSSVLTKTLTPYYFDNSLNVRKIVIYMPDANGLLEEKYEHRYIQGTGLLTTRIEEYTKTGSTYTLSAVRSFEYNNYRNTFALAYMSPVYINPYHYNGHITRETKTDKNEKVIYSIVNNYSVDPNSKSILTDIIGKSSIYSSDTTQKISKDFYSFICRMR